MRLLTTLMITVCRCVIDTHSLVSPKTKLRYLFLSLTWTIFSLFHLFYSSKYLNIDGSGSATLILLPSQPMLPPSGDETVRIETQDKQSGAASIYRRLRLCNPEFYFFLNQCCLPLGMKL